jgi:asparagine synthase (glutamine-hydrolysing)
MASQHVRVALNGLGGDELFCGYPSHRSLPRRLHLAAGLRRLAPWAVQAAATHLPWDLAEDALPSAKRLRVVGALLALLIEQRGLFMPPGEALRRAISFDGLSTSLRRRARLQGPIPAAGGGRDDYTARTFAEILVRSEADDPVDLVQALWIHTWLPGNGLLSLDKVTMAHSLEARVPFFDPPLMSFAMSIPSRIRLRAEKHVLREAVRDIVPPSVLRRRKKPFGTPIRSWFDNDLAERVQDILLDPRCLGRGWFDSVTLESLVLRHFRKEADHTELIFRLLLLELWLHSSFDAVPGRPAPQQVRMP